MASTSSRLSPYCGGIASSRAWALARALGQLPGLLWVQLDAEGRVAGWNSAASSFFDVRARQILDRSQRVTLESIVEDPDARRELRDAIDAASKSQERSFEVSLPGPTGALTASFEVMPTPAVLGRRGLALVGRLVGPKNDRGLGFAVVDESDHRLLFGALGVESLLDLEHEDPDRPARTLRSLPLSGVAAERRSRFERQLRSGAPASVELSVPCIDGDERALRLDAIALRGVEGGAGLAAVAVRPVDVEGDDYIALERRARRLRRVVEATSSVTGRGFLRSFVRSLTTALGVRVAYIAERVSREPGQLRMLNLWSGTEFTEGYTYHVAGSLDELVIADGPICYEDGLGTRISAHSWISNEGLVSYCGVPITDSNEQVAGVLAVMGTEPWDADLPVAEILGVFASRVGAELDRLRAEEALRTSEERWRSLLDNAPDAILALDGDARLRFHNLAEVSGAPLLGEPLESRVVPEHRATFAEALKLVIEQGQPTAIEIRARIVGEAARWHSLSLGPLRDSGDDAEAIVIATDIERAKRRAALARRRSVLEQRIATLSTRFFSLDHDRVEAELQVAIADLGQALGADSAFVYRFDPAGQSMVCTQTWAGDAVALFPPALGGDLGLEWLVERTAEGQESVFGAGELTVLSESERAELESRGVAALACVPLRGGDACLGLLGFAARSGSEAWDGELLALVRIAGDLTASIFERMRETELRQQLERELQQSQKLEAIGTLAGGLAHDFNNLLTAILGNTALLQQRVGEDAELGGLTRSIEVAAERAAELTSQMQSFGRRRNAQFDDVALHPKLEELAEILRRSFPGSIPITVDLAPTSITVHGDETLLGQALYELAINARDAMPDGGRLTIATRTCRIGAQEVTALPELSPGQFVAIEVRDEGVGMERSLRERVFEPFFTTRPAADRRGLGLANVYGIVRQHGGAVRVESTVGSGSIFSVLLPLADAGELRRVTLDPVPAAPVAAEAVRERRPESGVTVLVVDDEPVVLQTATAMLESLGYRALPAESGARAVELYGESEGQIKLVLLDLMMPGMNGRECLAALRAIDSQVRVVLSSGWGFEGIVEELRSEGILDFANKPYGLGTLARIVADALEAPLERV